MKSAEEHFARFLELYQTAELGTPDDDKAWCVAMFREIQADALRSAADLCDGGGPPAEIKARIAALVP